MWTSHALSPWHQQAAASSKESSHTHALTHTQDPQRPLCRRPLDPVFDLGTGLRQLGPGVEHTKLRWRRASQCCQQVPKAVFKAMKAKHVVKLDTKAAVPWPEFL